MYTVFLRSDAVDTVFFTACFCADTIQGQHLFLWKAHRHQQWLNKARTSNTVTTIMASSLHPYILTWHHPDIPTYYHGVIPTSLHTIMASSLHMAYGTPYVGMTPKKNGGPLKVHKDTLKMSALD